MTFNHIEYNLIDNRLLLLLSCNEDESMQAEVSLSKNEVMELFPNEFIMYRTIQKNGNAPEHIPSGECSFEFWYNEHMSKARAWRIFGEVEITKLTYNTTE